MIKAEVGIYFDSMYIGEYMIETDHPLFDVYKDDLWVKSFDFLEQAVSYCLENTKDE